MIGLEKWEVRTVRLPGLHPLLEKQSNDEYAGLRILHPLAIPHSGIIVGVRGFVLFHSHYWA